MKERPIIFDAESVRAILEGRKTQTRRVIKPQPTHVDGGGHPYIDMGQPDEWDGASLCRGIRCPYGQPGDRLWVRETFALMEDVTFYAADTRLEPKQWPNGLWNVDTWCSPIHMPRWASRITLEITGVRVEKLQEMVGSDFLAEGAPERYGSQQWCVDRWDTLNAKRGFPWSSNPWVWVVEFELVRQSL